MFVAVLLVLLAGGVLAACLQHARTQGWTAPGLPALHSRSRLPEHAPDDLPPPNLAPLIPSQRVITSEFERGLRELTFYLAVQPGE